MRKSASTGNLQKRSMSGGSGGVLNKMRNSIRNNSSNSSSGCDDAKSSCSKERIIQSASSISMMRKVTIVCVVLTCLFSMLSQLKLISNLKTTFIMSKSKLGIAYDNNNKENTEDVVPLMFRQLESSSPEETIQEEKEEEQSPEQQQSEPEQPSEQQQPQPQQQQQQQQPKLFEQQQEQDKTTNTQQEVLETTTTITSIDDGRKIPYRLVFTGKDNILETKTPPLIYDNIVRTIDTYKKAWNKPNLEVWFLTDDDCKVEIEKADGRLMDYFRALTRGALKSDICRVAALYNRGGYYFDIDMYALVPVHFDPDMQFASAYEPARNGFFQSFLASEPGHPVLKQAIEEMVAVHEKRRDVCEDMGTCTMKDAYFNVPVEQRGNTRLFQETGLFDKPPQFHSEVQRQEGYGGCCNYIVMDTDTDIVHFMSRIVGVSHCCMKVHTTRTRYKYHGKKAYVNTGDPLGYQRRKHFSYKRDTEPEEIIHGTKMQSKRIFAINSKA